MNCRKLCWCLVISLNWCTLVAAQLAHEKGERGAAKSGSALSASTDVAHPTGSSAAKGVMSDAGNDPFAIGPSDVLQITIWKQPDLSATATVRPDGSVSLPLINEVKVAGLSPAQIQKVLEDKYRQYLTDPHVSVTVSEIRSRKVFITGEVPRPGAYPLLSPVTVLQLIAEAGGFTQFSKRNKILILREADGAQIRLSFNYSSVVKGDAAHQNIALKPGDTVVVP